MQQAADEHNLHSVFTNNSNRQHTIVSRTKQLVLSLANKYQAEFISTHGTS